MKCLYPDIRLRQLAELGNRKYNHATVIAGIKRHHNLMKTDIEYHLKYKELESLTQINKAA